MELNNLQTLNFWRPVANHTELVFQEGPVQTGLYDETEGKNYEQSNPKQSLQNDLQDDEAYLISEGPSREIIEFEQNSVSSRAIEATIKEDAFILDETSSVFLTTGRSTIPEISVTINESIFKKGNEDQKKEEQTIILEVMLCEKSSCPQRQKFKILKGAITGCSRKKINQKSRVQFKGLKFNYNSNPDKNSKLLIALYKINIDRIRSYIQILVSRDIFIIQDGKAITIDTYEALYQYFENFTVDFMERPPSTVRINKQDKHTYHEEISTFEKYLIKKNKKVAHIVYLAFKFPHFVELYFRNHQKSSSQNQQIDLNMLLSNSLKQILSEINIGKYSETARDLVCNHFNPNTKIILSINANMRRVRFLMRKDFTRLISIIASQEQPNYQNFVKFSSNKQLKEFYLQYYTNAIRCRSPPIETLQKPHNTSPQPAQNPTISPINGNNPHQHPASDKKHPKRNNDEDYQEDEEEQLAQGDSDESQNYSISQKKGRKNAKKSEIRKHQHQFTSVNSKQIKYPTRNKTRQLEDEQDKKGILSRKNKQKQLLHQQQQHIKKSSQPGISGIYVGGMPGNLPFQIVNPQNPQIPSMGTFPMMQGLQIPAMGMSNPANKQSNPTQGKVPGPIPINPQMMGFMPNIFGMSGGIPAQIGGMMGQPYGLVNPSALMQQQQQKKENAGKDGKQQSPQNPALKQIPGTIPMGFNPSMLGMQAMQGMQGMPPGMNPFSQGMIPGGMSPIAIPGPNGTMMIMMPNMMGQNPNQGQAANQFPQIPGMVSLPPGFFFPPGMTNPFGPMGMNSLGSNHNNQSSQNSNDKNSGQTNIAPNPLMMGMMPPMLNPALLNQIMQQQNKSFLQKKDQSSPASLGQGLNQQRTNLDKNINSQLNPMQKNPSSDGKTTKKDEKPEGSFPPNIQNLMGMGGFGPGQNNPGMMMFPSPFQNPNMMQMMQGGFANSKDKNQQNQKGNMLPQATNSQALGQLGMGFGSMLGGNPAGMTPQILQQLSQTPGGQQMMQMGMIPPGFPLSNSQGQSSNNPTQQSQGQHGVNHVQGMNPIGMQGAGLGQISGQNFNEIIRQQQAIQEMLRKNGGGLMGGMPVMPGMPVIGGMPGIPGMGGMGGIGGIFMPPKKDDEEKK